MDFDPKSDYELSSLDDDELIDYISAARNTGHQGQMRTGLGIFVFRRHSQIVNRIRLKVDADEDIEDLAMRVMADVLSAKFDGHHAGEMVNLITTITKRRIADFHESRSKRREVPLPTGDDDDNGPEIQSDEDFTGEIALTEIVTDAIDALSESHSMVVQLSLTGLPATAVAEKVNRALPNSPSMTDANVHQITKRFRDRISRVLEESEK